MAIIAPRRSEAWFGPGGLPTVRFAEYIELSTTITNTSEETVTEVTFDISDLEFMEFWRS